MDPEVVAKETRREKDENGVHLFTISEFLTPLQLSSFFSRLVAKVRQQTVGEPALAEEDHITAANEEENFITARPSILASLNLSYLIVCGQNNLCELVRRNTLSNLNWISCNAVVRSLAYLSLFHQYSGKLHMLTC